MRISLLLTLRGLAQSRAALHLEVLASRGRAGDRGPGSAVGEATRCVAAGRGRVSGGTAFGGISAPIDSLYVDSYDSYRMSIGEHSNSQPVALLQGTLDMLILKSLVAGEMHGLGISRRIQQITRGTFVVKPGSLFPALHRMEDEGSISSLWGESENNRRAKYYQLTKAGRKQLDIETKRWGRISWAIAQALEA
jgi:PadR family transcriptional regulator PadR